MASRTITIRLGLKDHTTVMNALRKLGTDGEKALNRIQRAGRPVSGTLKGINQASKEGQNIIADYAAGSGALGRTLTAMGPAGLAAAAGIGALTLGLGKALRISREAITSFDHIAKRSQRLGIATDFLQEMTFAAEQSGVKVQALEMGLQRIARRAGEAAKGIGLSSKIFERLNVEVTDANGNMKSAEEIILDVADAIQGMDSHGERLAETIKLVDSEAAGMVNLLMQGSAAIEEFQEQAREAGFVIERDLLARAEQMADQLNISSKIIDTNLKSAFIELAPVLVKTSELLAGIAKGLNNIVQATKPMEEQSSRALRERQAVLEKQEQQTRDRINRLQRLQQRGIGERIKVPYTFGVQSTVDALGNAYAPVPTDAEIGRLKETHLGFVSELSRIDSILDERDRKDKERQQILSGLVESTQQLTDTNQKYIESLEKELEVKTLIQQGDRRQAAITQSLSRLSADATEEQIQKAETLAGKIFDITEQTKAEADAKRKALDIERERERVAKQELETKQRLAATERQRMESEAARLTERHLAPDARFQMRRGRLDQLSATGKLSPRAFSEEMKIAHREMLFEATDAYSGMQRALMLYTESVGSAADQMEFAFTNAFQSMEESLVDFAMTGRFSFERFFEDVARGLTRIAARKATAGLAGGLFGEGSIGASIFHDGGMVGGGSRATPQRNVPPSYFLGAPRYERGGIVGLRPGEIPAILHAGEMVIPRKEVKRGGGVTINQNNYFNGSDDTGGMRRNSRQLAREAKYVLQGN